MRHQTFRRLTVLGFLVGCGHSAPPTGADVDRWTGPWSPGPPERLYPGPVNLQNLTADGLGVLISWRAPVSPAAHRRDSMDAPIGYLPMTGGSGVWSVGDDRPSQRDSVNRITDAALGVDGRLLYVETTHPVTFDSTRHFPVYWHFELYLARPEDPGARRRLLQLFDEQDGHATVPDGTTNWLDGLQWVDRDHFAAVAASLLPNRSLRRQGLVIGTITADTTLLELVDDLTGVDRWSATGDGDVLIQSGLTLSRLSIGGGPRRPLAELPDAPGRRLVASRCDRDACWAITRDGAASFAAWRIWRLDPTSGTIVATRDLSPPVSGDPILPPTGTDVLVLYQGVLHRIAGVLSAP